MWDLVTIQHNNRKPEETKLMNLLEEAKNYISLGNFRRFDQILEEINKLRKELKEGGLECW